MWLWKQNASGEELTVDLYLPFPWKSCPNQVPHSNFSCVVGFWTNYWGLGVTVAPCSPTRHAGVGFFFRSSSPFPAPPLVHSLTRLTDLASPCPLAAFQTPSSPLPPPSSVFSQLSTDNHGRNLDPTCLPAGPSLFLLIVVCVFDVKLPVILLGIDHYSVVGLALSLLIV